MLEEGAATHELKARIVQPSAWQRVLSWVVCQPFAKAARSTSGAAALACPTAVKHRACAYLCLLHCQRRRF